MHSQFFQNETKINIFRNSKVSKALEGIGMPLHEVQFNYRVSYNEYTLITGCHVINTL